jgi:excisionase family DNA binding protein
MKETHLSIKDLAEREQVPESTVYRWNSDGTSPRYIRVGRFVRYRLSDVIAWENSRYADGQGAA